MSLALGICLSEVLEPDLRLVRLAGSLCKAAFLVLTVDSLDQHASRLSASLLAYTHILVTSSIRCDYILLSWGDFVLIALIESFRTDLSKRVLAMLRKATSKGSGTGVFEGCVELAL